MDAADCCTALASAHAAIGTKRVLIMCVVVSKACETIQPQASRFDGGGGVCDDSAGAEESSLMANQRDEDSSNRAWNFYLC
jgi:hypothetical protein